MGINSYYNTYRIPSKIANQKKNKIEIKETCNILFKKIGNQLFAIISKAKKGSNFVLHQFQVFKFF